MVIQQQQFVVAEKTIDAADITVSTDASEATKFLHFKSQFFYRMELNMRFV